MAVSAALVIALVAVFLPAGFVRGFIVGGCTVGVISALAVLVMQVTGTAQMSMGATAEQWTVSELRPLRKAGWQIINHVALRPWDIDHVVIGPGRVIAVETKWSSRGWSVDAPDERLLRALRQARDGANDLRRWQPLRDAGLQSVEPVLFLWGTNSGDNSPRQARPTRLEGVDVIRGREAAEVWRAALLRGGSEGDVDTDAVRRLWEALDKQVRRRDERELALTPPLPSLFRLYWTGLGVLALGLLSFFLSIEAWHVSRSPWAWSVIIIVLGVAGLAMRRAWSVRLFGTAWLTGVLSGALLVTTLLLRFS
jgi:hypothetical protein